MEYYLALKNEIVLFSGKWMKLENIMLSEVSQAQKIKGHMFFPHMWKVDLQDKCTQKYIYDYI
jgi:hypothetical protein